MNLVGADAHLGPEAEDPTVVQPGGGVDEDRGGIHLPDEALGRRLVGGDDGVGVGGAVGGDVVHGLLQ